MSTNIPYGYDQYSKYRNNQWPFFSQKSNIIEGFTPLAPVTLTKCTKLTKCPIDLTSNCDQNSPYQCLAGPATGQCTSNISTWQNSGDCNSYCNLYQKQTAPPTTAPMAPPSNSSKQTTCPSGLSVVCGQTNPYQCLSGAAIGGCSDSASTWENSSSCNSYCNISTATPARTTRTIKITNKCPKKIWIGTYGQNYLPGNGGFEMSSNTTTNLTVPSNWTAGRIWGRTNCKPGPNGQLVCETGDCNGQLHCTVTGTPPASLAEFTLSSDPTVPDYYDLSLVDGYNLPISISPIAGSYQNVNNPDLGRFNCGAPKCKPFDMSKCPDELLINGAGGTYCASICTAVNNPSSVVNPSYLQGINKDLVCCSCGCGPDCGCSDVNCKYGCSPYDNNPTNLGGKCYVQQWPLSSTNKQYNQIFKEQCPDAYSWQFDDISSTYQCSNADYEVTFC
jgi:hypothetical protein